VDRNAVLRRRLDEAAALGPRRRARDADVVAVLLAQPVLALAELAHDRAVEEPEDPRPSFHRLLTRS
jgi:hypothetical protein